jgi:histidine triad (HIT) family protein
MNHPTANGCVFCTRAENPAPLFETPTLYVMPDKFPLVPGHTLIISREHLPCYGAACRRTLQELDAAAATVRRFLAAAYGRPVVTWENGGAGQSVFHAHLHLIPVASAALPPEVAAHPDVAPVEGWDDVCGHYAQQRSYRYLQVAERRHLLSGYSPALAPITVWLAQLTGLQFGPQGWLKTTTPADVYEVARRWEAWSGD